MAKKKKYYVVWQGVNPGIYQTWDECLKQTKNYPNAKYKSYPTESAARAAFNAGALSEIKSKSKTTGPHSAKADYYDYLDEIITPSLSVDAASSGNPGIVEYQGVDTLSKKLLFKQGPFDKGTNNIGEYLALVHALAYLQKKGNHDMVVYSDSRTAMSWYKKRKVKTTFFEKYKNAELLDLVNRAIEWVNNNQVRNPVLKWNTKKWGEIPADFGRK